MKFTLYYIIFQQKLSFIIDKTLNVTSFVSEISISIFDVSNLFCFGLGWKI